MRGGTGGPTPRRMRERRPGGGRRSAEIRSYQHTKNSTVPNRPQVPTGDRLPDAQHLRFARSACQSRTVS
jgi:hypothetical protein